MVCEATPFQLTFWSHPVWDRSSDAMMSYAPITSSFPEIPRKGTSCCLDNPSSKTKASSFFKKKLASLKVASTSFFAKKATCLQIGVRNTTKDGLFCLAIFGNPGSKLKASHFFEKKSVYRQKKIINFLINYYN